jgi:type IV pilus assembly protein PilQ
MKSWKIAALLAVLVLAAGCSANPRVSEPAQQLPPMPASVQIGSIEHAVGEGSTRVMLHGNFPFSYTSYEPDPSTLVLELLDVDATPIAGVTPVDSPEVDLIETSVKGEALDGAKVSQVTLHLKRPARHELRMQGNDLILEFRPEESAPGSEMASNAGPAPAPAPEILPEATPAASPARPAPPAGKPATALTGVVPQGAPSASRVELRSDGVLRYRTMQLKNPDRLVVDLEGVSNKVPAPRRTQEPESDFVRRIRVAQFSMTPEKVARVVFDLKAPAPYTITPSATGLSVEFGAAMAQGAPQIAPAPVPAETPSETAAASARPSEPPSGEEEPAQLGANLAAETPSPDTGTGLSLIGTGTTPEGMVPPETPAPAPAAAPATSEAETGMVPMRPAKPRSSPRETTIVAQNRFSARDITDTGAKYTGKRISLNFKDADLKDVFRIFHEISGYNIVLDPGVSGNVTIVLENVPEDQALDIILKNNGLDKIFENNVIRIASTSKLSQEAAARKALQEAKELEEQPVTFTRSLSYAKAKDVVPIVKRIMSKRGDVIMDDRTNTLIISDIAAKRDPINRLIDSLDEQTPQVSIEARIVETDREFERDLGISWGVNARWDPALGTQTGLQFPHRADVSYDVSLPAKATAGSLGLSFGNVLDSLTLDMKLDAFELNGDVKILSAPKVTTQNNQTAVIEQGVQIPVVNTTATEINVEFISASLKLEVTPQITKEGTVIMVVKVDNSSPDFVNRVGDVPPIITERAQTQILVEDGGTAVIGGIFRINDAVTETGVPGLKRIPGLGWLFKNKTVNRKNTELLIFITPRILKKA